MLAASRASFVMQQVSKVQHGLHHLTMLARPTHFNNRLPLRVRPTRISLLLCHVVSRMVLFQCMIQSFRIRTWAHHISGFFSPFSTFSLRHIRFHPFFIFSQHRPQALSNHTSSSSIPSDYAEITVNKKSLRLSPSSPTLTSA